MLHDNERLIHNLYDAIRVLKLNGFFCIIDWEKKETEMGPSINERISKEEMIQTCVDANFIHVEDIDINADHYGLKFQLV